MSAPPPYYENVSQLEGSDVRDLASEIKLLSNQTIQSDKNFQDVQVIIGRDGLVSSELRGEWRDLHKVYTDLLWEARSAATQVGSYNRDFVDVIIPTLADTRETTPNKIAELEMFIKKSPPTLLTETEATVKIEKLKMDIKAFTEKHYADGEAQIASENERIKQFKAGAIKQKEEQEKTKGGLGHLLGFTRPPHVVLVNYDAKIEQAGARIVALSEHQTEVKQATSVVLESLEGIAERIGSSFATVWKKVNEDARHIKTRMEASDADVTPDIAAAGRMYARIKEALTYFATNVSKCGI